MTMMLSDRRPILLANARIVDPSRDLDIVGDLLIADGVVRSQGRKIIFSTNLPNVGDLDEALIRPGRCFARVHVRTLTGAEAQALAEELGSPGCALDAGRRHSLAEVYRAAR